MKTAQEICEYIRKNQGFLDFAAEALITLLPFELAKEWLTEDVNAENWKQSPTSDEAVLARLADYMKFAWGKVEDHRGISAGRSVDKCTAWAWYLRGDDIVAQIEETGYAQYGAPKLAIICKALDLPIPASNSIQRMIAGNPCVDDCGMGCGQ